MNKHVVQLSAIVAILVVNVWAVLWVHADGAALIAATTALAAVAGTHAWKH